MKILDHYGVPFSEFSDESNALVQTERDLFLIRINEYCPILSEKRVKDLQTSRTSDSQSPKDILDKASKMFLAGKCDPKSKYVDSVRIAFSK